MLAAVELEYAGAEVPTSQIRAVAQKIAPAIAEWSPGREEPRGEKVPTMYISYDGTGVPMRKEETQGRKGKQADGSSITRELKLGCIFTSHTTDKEGNPLRDTNSTTLRCKLRSGRGIHREPAARSPLSRPWKSQP